MRWQPTPEAIKVIAKYRAERKKGRQTRPLAKEICHRFGLSERTLYRVGRILVP